jgi:hypothetical protein
MSDVPKSVADADQELDALLEGLEKGSVPDPEVPAPTPETPVTGQPKVETPVDDPPEPPKPGLEKQLEKAEQRYRTLEGMMKADRKRQAEIIEGLQEQLAAQKAAEVEAPLDVASILSEDEMAQFGEDGVRVLEKLAGAIAAKEVSKKALEVERRLNDMQKRVDHAEASSEGNTTWDLVEKINPGAKQINASDHGWFAFLEEPDPVSGTSYRDIGQAAASVNDIQRLSELIDLYRESANLVKPVIPVKPSQNVHVAPPNDGNSPQSAKREYTQDEVRDFYHARALGKESPMTKGLNADQLQALEADIDAAMEEGRIKL